jgi:hypothetical protein
MTEETNRMDSPHSYSAKELAELIRKEGLYAVVANAAALGKIQRLRESFLAALDGSNGPTDEALAALIELHKYLDFEEPIKANDAMTFENPEGVNEAMAKAYAVIRRQEIP